MVSTRATVGGALAAGAILVTGWGVGTGWGAATSAVSTTATDTTTTGASASAASGSSSGSSSTSSGSTTESSGSAASGSTVVDGTYTGDAYSTRWGDVQVSVTISGGQVTEVTALQLTDSDRKSVQISNRAAPILRDEVIAAQSANVSMVSGATYTSDAYLSSVQSALDQAGL